MITPKATLGKLSCKLNCFEIIYQASIPWRIADHNDLQRNL